MEIEARFAALEQAVAELHARLDHVPRGSMQQTLRCPACGGDRILHVRRVLEATRTESMPLSLGSKFNSWRGHQPGDPLELFVCRGCGLVEWHATGLDKLEVDGVNVVELTREKPAGEPYR